MKPKKTQWIPKGYKARSTRGVDVGIYVNGLSVIAYPGKKTRADFYILFPTLEARDRYIKNYLDKKRAEEKERLAAKKAKAEYVHNLKVGDIIYNSWGYDQTNIDFYQVVDVPGPKTIRVRRISQVISECSPRAMSGVTTPCPGQFLDKEPELLKRVTGAYDGEPWINFEYGGGRKWDGKPIGCSWYA